MFVLHILCRDYTKDGIFADWLLPVILLEAKFVLSGDLLQEFEKRCNYRTLERHAVFFLMT